LQGRPTCKSYVITSKCIPREGKQAGRVPAPGGQPLLVGLVYIEPTLAVIQALKQLFMMKWVTGCRISPRGTCVKSAGLNAQKRWKLDF
jgi:hypothetical protein